MRIVKVTDAEGNTTHASGEQTQSGRSPKPSPTDLQHMLEQLQQEKKKQYDELTAQQQKTQAQLLTEQKRNVDLQAQLENAWQQNTDLQDQLEAAREAEQKQQAQFQQWSMTLEEMKELSDGEFVQESEQLIRRYRTLKMELGTAEDDLTKDSEQLRQILTSEFADKDRLVQAEKELQQLKEAMEVLQKKLCSLSGDAAHSGDERTKELYQEEGARR